LIKKSYIQKLIEKGEDQTLDFKFEISDSKKIARTLSAFSNTDGGILLIGIKDNGAIAGVRTDEEYYMIEAAANMYCKPEPKIITKVWNESGKKVLEVIVPKNGEIITYALGHEGKWLAYLRENDNDRLANTVILKLWKKKIADSSVYIKFSSEVEHLLKYLKVNDSISISKYCRIAGIKRNAAEYVIVNLILLKIIDIYFDDNNFLYKLHENPE
jgi:predicted HTH transcriptional regulator